MRAALALALALIPAGAGAETADEAYRRGFQDGVEAVNAQLGTVTAQMQTQVQRQVNDQLARIQAQHEAELEQRLAAAQQGALTAQGPVAVEGMPRLPPLTVAPGGAVVPRSAPAGLPADPAGLPEGTTITVTNPQNLPREVYRALIEYVGR